MRTLTIRTQRPYDVLIAPGLLNRAGQELARVLPPCRAVLVADDTVGALYSDAVLDSLRAAGFDAALFAFPHGEQSKTMLTYQQLLDFLCARDLTRRDILLALGGGVTGDLCGFAAATYLRGVRYVQLPTTLLAAVDSSVGGKTAVDLPGGKNQVGAFHPPALVLCDPDCLRTLPAGEYRNGCGEIVKYAMLSGEPLLSALLSAPVSRQAEQVIAACVECKRRFVQADEFDTGRRRLLNFGHTVGHAIEVCSGYTVPHGMAIAAGMAILTRAACRRGICGGETLSALESLLQAYDLPSTTGYPARELAEAALADKKRRGDALSIILPEAVGRCRVETIPASELASWLRDGGLL